MNKEKFFTIGWNNLLTLALGIPTGIFVYWAFASGTSTTLGGMIGLSIIGVLYWVILEGHTSMRFAWLKENSDNDAFVQQAFMHPLAIIRKIYNLVFWIFLLPFFTLIDYGTGFIIFTIIIGIRLVLNLYTNNLLDLTPQRYENYPFRIP